MRVWLVEEQHVDGRPPLEVALRQLAECPGARLTLLGTGLLGPGHLTELRGWQLDVVVVPEHLWPAEPEAQALLDLEVGVLVVAGGPGGPIPALAETYPVSLVAAPRQAEDLWPALLGCSGPAGATSSGKDRSLASRPGWTIASSSSGPRESWPSAWAWPRKMPTSVCG